MPQSTIAVPRKVNSKPPDLSKHVAELVTVTNSIITNIQGQSDVNEALTKRLLALEDRLSQLETRSRPAPAASAAAFSSGTQGATPPALPPAMARQAAKNPVPKNLPDLIQRAVLGENVNKSIYLGDHLALTQVLDRFKMFVDTRDMSVAPTLMFGGIWEVGLTKVFCELLRPGMTVVDVGANIGYYSLLAASGIHLANHVHAVEADPHNFELLGKNVEINGYEHIVRTYQCAALNVRRDVTLNQFRNHFGGNGIFSDPADPRIAHSVTVPGVPLDELINDTVDVVKIDAEGCEPLIFDGMQQMIRRSPNIQILMEFAPHMIRATIDPAEFLNRIRRTGLKVQSVSCEGQLETWPDERLLTPEIHTVHISRGVN